MALTLAAEAASLASAQGIVSTESADADRLVVGLYQPRGRLGAHPGVSPWLPASGTRKYEWRGHNAAEGVDPATQDAIATLERIVRDQAALKSIGTPTSTNSWRPSTLSRATVLARLAWRSELPGLYVVTLAVSGAALILTPGPYASRRQALRNAGRRARSCGRAEHGPTVRHRHAVAWGGGCEWAADRPGHKGPPSGIFPPVASSADAAVNTLCVAASGH